jgi:tetratricopeptide (TPR) repeat protein
VSSDQGQPPQEYSQLAQDGGEDEASRRQRDDLLALAEEAEPHLTGPDQALWLGRLDAQRDKFDRALTLCLKEKDGVEQGLRLAAALARFWWMRGHAPAGRRWMAAVLHRTGGSRGTRARALQGAGALAYAQADYAAADQFYGQALGMLDAADQRGLAQTLNQIGMVAREQGDLDSACSLHERSAGIYRALQDTWGIASCLSNLGVVARLQGDVVRAQALHQEALVLRRQMGDVLGMASSLSNLGNLAQMRDDLAAARRYQEEALALRRSLGDRWGVAGSLLNLGNVARAQGDRITARPLLEESLQLLRELDDGLGLCECLEGFAELAAAEGRPEIAVQLLSAADKQRRDLHAPLPRSKGPAAGAFRDSLKSRLGLGPFMIAWTAGESLRREAALLIAISSAPGRPHEPNS